MSDLPHATRRCRLPHQDIISAANVIKAGGGGGHAGDLKAVRSLETDFTILFHGGFNVVTWEKK